jgi:hypothetical protein
MSSGVAVATPCLPGAATHDTSVASSWMELLVAEEDWVRREFEEIVAAGWGGSRPTLPNAQHGTHEPRRSGPRSRFTPDGRRREVTTRVAWRTLPRGPPPLGEGS